MQFRYKALVAGVLWLVIAIAIGSFLERELVQLGDGPRGVDSASGDVSTLTKPEPPVPIQPSPPALPPRKIDPLDSCVGMGLVDTVCPPRLSLPLPPAPVVRPQPPTEPPPGK